MTFLIRSVIWLVLLPIRLLVLSFALFCLGTLYLVGLGQSYLATIIKNIASNFFFPKSFDLDSFRKKHTHILGSTGSGKSSTIEFFIDQNIQKGQGFILIEPHGELGQRVLHNKRFSLKHPSQAYQKLMYLDFDQSPPALNLFKLPLPKNDKTSAAFIDGLATELADAFCMNMKPATSESQFMMLRNLLIAGFYIKDVTFKDLLKMLSPQSESLIKNAIGQLPSPALQQYFQSDYFSVSAKRTKEALRLRLTNLVIPQSLYNSLCANECSVNFESILAENRFVIVKASAPLLGSYQAQTIGNIIVNLINKYAFERLVSGKEPSPFFVYLDEAQYYINPAIQRALTGVRKTGLNFTLAHQELCQEGMTPAEQRTIINNTQVKIYGSLQWKDQKESANILHLNDPQILDQLQPGQFILKAGRHEPGTRQFPSKFAVPKVAFGRGVFVNAYMNTQAFGSLLKQFKQQVDKNVLAETLYVASGSESITPQGLQHLSFKSFNVHGSKSHQIRRT